MKYLTSSGLEEFVVTEEGSTPIVSAFVDSLKDRIEKVRYTDDKIKAYAKQEKVKKKRTISVDSDLSEFMA